MMTKIRESYKETEIGVIPEDWKIDFLDNVAQRLTGHTPNKKIESYWGGEIPWVSLKDTFRLDKGYVYETTDYTTIDGINNSSAVLLPEGTVIISRDATVGKVGITSTEMATSQHFINYVCGESLNNKYLYYTLLKRKDEFVRIAIGSTIKTIGMPYFKALKVMVPPLPEQERIAEILSTADDHIEKLDKIIEDYQLLKKGMMKKLLTEGIGHTEFKETEIGRIPKEWEVTTFKNIIENTQLGINEKSSEKNTGISLIKMGNLTIGGFDFSKIERLETEIIDNYSDYILEYGDFLFNTRNTPELVGKSATWKYNDRLSVFNSNIMRISVSSNIDTFWLSYYFASRNGWKSLKQISTGTTSVGAIYTKDLVKVEIPLPPLQEQQKIAHVISAIDEQIYKLELQMVDFVELKKSLMEKLLTGKVRVI